MSNLVSTLSRRACEDSNATYLIYQGSRVSYAQLHQLARRVCCTLRRMFVVPGSYVILLLDNGPNFFATFFGVQMCGAIPVPLSPKSTKNRIAYIARDCKANMVVVNDNYQGELALESADIPGGQVPVLRVRELLDDHESGDPVAAVSSTAFVQYTSGSTGEAKGAVISHRAVLANIAGFAPGLAVSRDRDVFSSMMPMFHDMGLVCFGLGSLVMGVPLAIYRQEALSLYNWLEGIAEERVTITGGPNLFLHLATRVVRDPQRYDLSSLRAFVCGSEPISVPTVRSFEALYGVPGVVKPAYGMAEISLSATATPIAERYEIHKERVISCGRPLPGVDIVILPEDGPATGEPHACGEILIKSPALMDGYLNRPELTSQVIRGGYYHSGDLGYFDGDGRLYVTGRKKNLIIRGGEKFAPAELEAVATHQREVAQCAVVGVEDPGQAAQSIVLVAEVEPNTRTRPEVLSDVARRICKSAARDIGWMPEVILFARRGMIPRTLNGKIQHSALRTQLEKNDFASDVRVRTADLQCS